MGERGLYLYSGERWMSGQRKRPHRFPCIALWYATRLRWREMREGKTPWPLASRPAYVLQLSGGAAELPIIGNLFVLHGQDIAESAGYFDNGMNHFPVLPVTEHGLGSLEPFSSLSQQDWIFFSGREQAYSLQPEAALVDAPAIATLRPVPTADESSEREFMAIAIEEARKCKPEDDRVHPLVGVVVVKDGRLIARAHRGETAPGDHAEFIALEKKLAGVRAAGATVYTTLEPCTTRNHPKRPCVEHIRDHRIKRVVFGTLDPDKSVHGGGELMLRDAQVEIGRFDPDFMAELEELNLAFTRSRRSSSEAESPPSVNKQPIAELQSELVLKPSDGDRGYELRVMLISGATIDDGRITLQPPLGFGIKRTNGGWHQTPSLKRPRVTLDEPLHRGDGTYVGRLCEFDKSLHTGAESGVVKWILTGRNIDPIEGELSVNLTPLLRG